MSRFVDSLHYSLPGFLATIAVAAAATITPPAQAVALRLGPLTFSEASGNFALTNGRVDGGGLFILEQEVYGPDINLFIAVDGLRSACRGFYGGCYFPVLSLITNRTGTTWTFMDHELQEIFRVPSPEADGLSFAQGIPQVRPFSSDRLPGVDEVTDVRDYINFSAGTVAPNETVGFRYWIQDTTPIDRFYLLQRPNYQVGVGFVNPTPPPVVVVPEPVPTPVAVAPSPNPSSSPSVTAPSEPTGNTNTGNNSAAVPEPSTVLGVLLFGAIAGSRRLKRSH